MNLENIKKFIELAKSEGASELKYEEKEVKISVNFGISGSQVMMPAAQIAAPAAAPAATVIANDKTSENEDYHLITSPFVGTFYASPAPGKPSFVKLGDKVSNGQTLCVLEAMKIMNEIEANTSGEIIEICVENESLVEYGQTLFKIKA